MNARLKPRSPALRPATSALLGAGCFILVAVADGRAAEPVPSLVAVTVDNAKVIRLPERTQTVIVGNPIIADVSLQKNGVLILTGKSFGSTNLIALDAAGTMLAESTISVQTAPVASVMTVQRGLDRESYSCTPHCQPSIQLGDSAKYYGEISGQADGRRAMATGAAGGK